jgi:hypothetical protein
MWASTLPSAASASRQISMLSRHGKVPAVHLPFYLRGIGGDIDITVDVTRNPDDLCASPGAIGLPHCHAVVEYPGEGYAGMLGWIQLVRSTDNSSRGEQFEMDPLMFVGEVPHPFALFGITPTLFDAPARRSRLDLDWQAHSFLCHIKDFDGDIRVVQAITGFSWGFAIKAGATTVESARRLGSDDWRSHLGILHDEHPGWRFLDELATT